MGTVGDKDIRLKAYDFVLEWSKLIVTISSASLVLTITFVKDLVKGTVNCRPALVSSWVLLLHYCPVNDSRTGGN